MSLTTLIAEPTAPTQTGGRWHALQFSPDPAGGERVNIGIVMYDETGQGKLVGATNLSRYRCAYGDQVADHIGHCLAVARDTLASGQTTIEHPHLSLFGGMPMALTDVNGMLAHLLHEQVPLSRPIPGRGRPAVGRATRSLRTEIAKQLRQRLDLRADRILPQKPTLRTVEDSHRWELDVPLQAPVGFGSIISAQLRNADRIAQNANNAAFDLQIAADLHKKPRMALFMLRPADDSMDAESLERVDQAIDRIVRGLRHQNVHAVADITADQMTDSIIDWSGV